MIIETQAVTLDENNTDCATKVEIVCPSCSRDIDETELFNKVCNDCGADLSDPTQHIAIAVTSVPVLGITW
jgi:predicted amidophosphoribosyltransferase